MCPTAAGSGSGDVLVGMRSSGPHTNGYSLIRSIFRGIPLATVFPELGVPLVEALLAPHRSYYPILYPCSLISRHWPFDRRRVHREHPAQLPGNVDAVIDTRAWNVPGLFRLIQERGEIAPGEMFRVFNMGIGMVAVVDRKNVHALKKAIPEEIFMIGELVEGKHRVIPYVKRNRL